ncbi:MAG: hypothetical protein AB7O44_27420 [Hyphomicrobiaceae bacterium]
MADVKISDHEVVPIGANMSAPVYDSDDPLANKRVAIGTAAGQATGAFLTPAQVAAGTITPASGAVDLTGSEGHVLTKVGSDLVMQAPTAATVNVDQHDLVGRTASGNGAAGGIAAGDLTEVEAPAAGDFVPVWVAGTTLRKADVGDLPVKAHTHGLADITDAGDLAALDEIGTADIASAAYASEGDATTGEDNAKIMTALRVAQAISALGGDHSHTLSDISDAGALAALDEITTDEIANVPGSPNTYLTFDDSGVPELLPKPTPGTAGDSRTDIVDGRSAGITTIDAALLGTSREKMIAIDTAGLTFANDLPASTKFHVWVDGATARTMTIEAGAGGQGEFLEPDAPGTPEECVVPPHGVTSFVVESNAGDEPMIKVLGNRAVSDMAGQILTNFSIGAAFDAGPITASGALTKDDHSGRYVVTSGSVVIPNAAGDVGMWGTIEGGGAHDVTFNGASLTLASGDLLTYYVKSTTVLTRRLSPAADSPVMS